MMAVDELGDLQVVWSNGYLSEVPRASPRVLLADELLCALMDAPDSGIDLQPGHQEPFADAHDRHLCPMIWRDPAVYWCFYGSRLTFTPLTGARLIYIIGEYEWNHRAWHAAWPD